MNWLNLLVQNVETTLFGTLVTCYVMSDTDEIVTTLSLGVSNEIKDEISENEYFTIPHLMLVERDMIVAIQTNLKLSI
jgi:hypothetical protein